MFSLNWQSYTVTEIIEIGSQRKRNYKLTIVLQCCETLGNYNIPVSQHVTSEQISVNKPHSYLAGMLCSKYLLAFCLTTGYLLCYIRTNHSYPACYLITEHFQSRILPQNLQNISIFLTFYLQKKFCQLAGFVLCLRTRLPAGFLSYPDLIILPSNLISNSTDMSL